MMERRHRPADMGRKVVHRVPAREWARRMFVGATGSCGQLSGARKPGYQPKCGPDFATKFSEEPKHPAAERRKQ
jgi:hypothetical protein